MSWFSRDRGPFHRSGDDEFSLGLSEQEQVMMRSLLGQLRMVLRTEAGQPEGVDETTAVRRLFPTAYSEDEDLEREYQSLVHDDLLARRLEALDSVEATLNQPHLAGADLQPWMTAVNDLRLVLGTRLDVSEEMDDIDPEDPDAAALAAYHYLGWLLEHIVAAQTTLL